jgi:DNA modification methylase
MQRFDVGPGDTVLDPFSGTGTTVVTAVLQGVNGVGLEVNPFLSFAGQVKLDWSVDLGMFERVLVQVLEQAKPLLDSLSVERDIFTSGLDDNSIAHVQDLVSQLAAPAMPRLFEWMTPVVVHKVLILRHLIETSVPESIRPHFLLALASILRPVSNMKLTAHAFGSQVRKDDAPVYELFEQKIVKIFKDLIDLQYLSCKAGTGQIIHGDARTISAAQSSLLPASLAITSPPYLNNLDYTMQTRMELFFLRFVADMTDLRNLRKAMVICDAKAMYKDIKDSECVQDVESIQDIAHRLEIAHAGKNWGWNYAFMTTQYFGGMVRVLHAVHSLLKPGANFVLIVGESAHSGVKVPVPDILAELGERSGYRFQEINVIRRRRSSSHKYELCESAVILQKK